MRIITLIGKTSVKTFQYNGLTIELHPEVYEPAEDTFQLLEVLEINPNDTVLEIGTGCGIIALECAHHGAQVVCIDINPHAVKLAQRNYIRNKSLMKGSIEIRCGDMFSVLKPDEEFDVILFNPPYLPTSEEEKVGKWFDIATNGGIDGLEITKQFIEGLHKHLRKNGHAYVIFSSLADRKTFATYVSNAKLKVDIILSRWYNDEQIDVYCIHF